MLFRSSENVSAHPETVMVQQNSDDVQEHGGLGGIGDESPMYMLLEEILVDEELLFADAHLFPPVGAPPDSEDFIVDQNVLDANLEGFYSTLVLHKQS